MKDVMKESAKYFIKFQFKHVFRQSTETLNTCANTHNTQESNPFTNCVTFYSHKL